MYLYFWDFLDFAGENFKFISESERFYVLDVLLGFCFYVGLRYKYANFESSWKKKELLIFFCIFQKYFGCELLVILKRMEKL